jgi:ADP-ribosylglycohydrolase
VLAQHGAVDQDEFARRLVEVVRGGRDHGWGAATLGAVRRMVGGMSWRDAAASSGQCGNGTVMRVVPVGAWFAEAPDVVVAGQAERQSRVTHADDHCAAAAILVALAAADAVRVPARHVLAQTHEWAGHIEHLDRVLAGGVAELPRRLRLSRQDAVRWAAEHAPGTTAEVMGVPGTAGATALFALWCWLRTPRAFMPAVLEAISAGGDTDTVAAVVGGLVGATTGARRLPRFFTHRLRDVPHWRAEHLAVLCEEAWRRHRLIP